MGDCDASYLRRMQAPGLSNASMENHMILNLIPSLRDDPPVESTLAKPRRIGPRRLVDSVLCLPSGPILLSFIGINMHCHSLCSLSLGGTQCAASCRRTLSTSRERNPESSAGWSHTIFYLLDEPFEDRPHTFMTILCVVFRLECSSW